MSTPIFQPPFVSPYVAPYASMEIKNANGIAIHESNAKILDHLGEISPVADHHQKRSWKPKWNNNFCNLVTYIANNWWEITKDACGDYFCCFKKRKAQVKDSKKYKVPITKEFHRVTRQATKDFHTNLFGLGVIAPALIVSSGLTNSFALTIISGLTTLYYAGARTYVFSGDFGVQNFNGNLTLGSGIRLAATEAFKGGHSMLVNSLEETWKSSSEGQRFYLYERCHKITQKDNWENILLWLNVAGIHNDEVKVIMTPFRTFSLR